MTLLTEGGSAVGGARIPRERVQPTIAAYVEKVLAAIPYDKFEPVGSTGKKSSNGDIDLAVETTLSLEEISRILTQLGIEHILAKGLGELNTKFPQYDENGPTEDFAQVDLMVGPPGAIDWLTFVYYAPYETETSYKPLNRTGTLYALLRCATEEVRDDGLTYFYSMAPNRGVFHKAGKTVINKKGVEEFKSDRVEEGYHQDPHYFCKVISTTSSEKWAPEELKDTCEHIWAKIKTRYNPEIQAHIDEYIRGFSENQKVPITGSIILNESVNLQEAKLSHFTHIEDLLYDEGAEGGEKIFRYLISLFDELKGNTPEQQLRTTIKIDGMPAVNLASSYPGIDGPFIGMKMMFAKNPQIFRTPEEIDARYADKPDLAKKLKLSLNLASTLGIPEGEIWKGEFLFTKEDLHIQNIDGEDFIIFTPNTITYAAPLNSEIGQRLNASEVGIAFHTIVRGNDLRTAEGTASFFVDASILNQLPGVFAIDANTDSIAGTVTLTEEETQTAKEALDTALDIFSQIHDFLNQIGENPINISLLNKFENQAVKMADRTEQFGDPEQYVDGLIAWAQSQYKTAKRQDEIAEFFGGQNRQNFILLFQLQSLIVEIKNLFLRKLENLPKTLIPYDKEPDGTLRIANDEGFAVSDIDGNVIKLVDRLGFSRKNFARREVPLQEALLIESPASDAWEHKIAADISSKYKKHGIIAERPSTSTSYSDVLVICDKLDKPRTWLEVKMNHTDNLSNPRFFFDGKTWGSTYGGIAPTLVEFLNNSTDVALFVRELGKFAGIKGKPIIPTNKSIIKQADPTTTITRDTMARFLRTRSQYILDLDDVDLAPYVIQHYKDKEEPASYLQAGDDFYILTSDPLGFNKRRTSNAGWPRLPKIMGTGKLRVRVGVRTEFYEIQAEVKITNMPDSPYSVLKESKKLNPFDILVG